MSKRNLSFLIIALVIVLIGIFFFFFLRGGGSSPQEDGRNNQNDIFSFSDSTTETGEGESTETELNIEELSSQNKNSKVSLLRKVSFKPISGFGLFGTTTSLLRYVDKESGHIFETFSDSLTTTRITNTTIPKVFDSLWISQDQVVLRYFDDNEDIQSFSATITPPEDDSVTEKNSLVGGFLEKNIKEMQILGKNIFSLIDVGVGSSGMMSGPNLETKRQVWETPLKEISILKNNEESISILTKPSHLVFGHLFLLNTRNSFFEKSISEIKGLTANISPGTKMVLYSRSETIGVSLWLFDNSLKESTRLAFSTLPEKCVWSILEEGVVYCGVPKNISVRALPDEWYKGRMSFSDEIWKLNLITGEKEMLIDPQKLVGEEIDLITPVLSEDETYFVFVNKKDSSLWGLLLDNQ